MALLSIFKRQAEAAGAASLAGTVDAVQRARTRARQRLIGAVVLVLIGVIGFPLVFETQPRPIPVDIPIDVPRKEGAPALAMPPARTPRPSIAETPAVPPAAGDTTSASPPADAVITESRDESGRDITPSSAGTASAAPAIEPRAVSKPIESVPAARPAPAVKPPEEPRPAPSSEGARARALLDGKPVAKPTDAGRYVVQVGAFADAVAARDTRTKVEKLGLKTYTQVASTSAGSRIRVRVGPFASRDEADKALARARSAGLTAVVLTL